MNEKPFDKSNVSGNAISDRQDYPSAIFWRRWIEQPIFNLIPNVANGFEFFRLGSLHRSGVGKWPVPPLGNTGKYRTALFRVMADRDNVVIEISRF
jgi:hypothetical protein